MAELRLGGCRSRPLLGYLKALGVLRLVSRQADAAARGRWRDGVFELASGLGWEDLQEFFLVRYAPTPILSPWNGRSGFYSKRNASMEAINASHEGRLAPYRLAFARAAVVVDRLGLNEQPKDVEKGRLVAALRNELPDEAIEWLDAAVVIVGGELRFPPLLASGGADGSYDFSKNFADALVLALGVDGAAAEQRGRWLEAALRGSPTALVAKLSGSQFHRDASPTNSPFGEDDALGNPWDLVLAIEGCLLLAPGAARRHEAGLPGGLVAPFTARSTAAGYGSAVTGERGRAELWLPLWSAWTTLTELETVVREARAQVGRRGARTGLDFVRAAGSLGVTRGIDGFERFSILERAGQSGLAVPAGRISVTPRPAARAIGTIEAWLDAVLAGRGRLPQAAVTAANGLERALFAFAEAGTPATACAALERIGSMETALAVAGARASVAGLRPLDRADASPWLEAADDGSAEFTVAACLASLRDRRDGPLPAIREYLHGTVRDDRGRQRYDAPRGTPVPRRADPVARLAAVHARRHLDAMGRSPSAAGSGDRRALAFDTGIPCPLAAMRRFAAGGLDDARVMRLAGGLALLSFPDSSWRPRHETGAWAPPVPALELLALAWAEDEAGVGARPGWAAMLQRNRVEAVLCEAALRLRMARVVPVLEPEDVLVGSPSGPRLAAALLQHLSHGDRSHLRRRLTIDEPSNEGATV